MITAETEVRPLLRVDGLCRPGLDATRLELQRGECVAILGPSGAGKSLLLRAIADLDPNEGEVFLGGQARSALTGPEWRRRVVYLAAESAWWTDTVAACVPKPEVAESLLPIMKLPEDALTWSIRRLSTGEKQRLALARALSLEPAVLLADEPTAALDEATTQGVERMLAERLKHGMGLILITHAQSQAERLADRVLRMTSGRLEAR